MGPLDFHANLNYATDSELDHLIEKGSEDARLELEARRVFRRNMKGNDRLEDMERFYGSASTSQGAPDDAASQ